MQVSFDNGFCAALRRPTVRRNEPSVTVTHPCTNRAQRCLTSISRINHHNTTPHIVAWGFKVEKRKCWWWWSYDDDGVVMVAVVFGGDGGGGGDDDNNNNSRWNDAAKLCKGWDIISIPVCEPPSFISDFRLHHTISKIASLNSMDLEYVVAFLGPEPLYFFNHDQWNMLHICQYMVVGCSGFRWLCSLFIERCYCM